MSKVLAYHLILTCYGFWLPNDPRGSGSTEVWADWLKPFGPATHVHSERSVAHRSHDKSIRLAAKRALKHKPARLNGRQAQCVARGFGEYLSRHAIQCLACSVMPDHAHLVLLRSDRPIETIAIGLKSASVAALNVASLHPYPRVGEAKQPKLWARGDRHRFLFDDAGIDRAVRYVEDNPLQCGFKRQRWSFVEIAEPRTK